MLSRRDFLERAAALTVAGLASEAPVSAAAPLGRVGVALFTIPKLLDQDFAGALTLLADIGYKEVQFFGRIRSASRRRTSAGNPCPRPLA